MTAIDLALVTVGAIVTLVGVIQFVRGKVSNNPSKVEAFGIKLDITNPSLILILAGVGLMLAPRLLPEPTAPEADEKPVVVATAPVPEAAPTLAPAAPQEKPSSVPAVTSTPTAPAAPKPQPTSVATDPAPAPTPPVSRPAPKPLPKPIPTPIPKPQFHAPVIKPTPTPPARAPAPSMAPRVTPSNEPATPVPQARPPTAPAYLVAALGTPNVWKDFWANEKQADYSRKLAERAAERLRRVARDANVETLSGSGASTLMDNATTRQRRCQAGGFAVLVVIAVVQPDVVISNIDSAYWPELTLLLHDCKDGTVRRELKQLAPRNADRFPFETELVENLDRALRDLP
jgi:hypothetical protein